MRQSFLGYFLTLSCLTCVSLATSLAMAADEKAKPAAKAPAGSGEKPTEANVSYGSDPKQILDFYKAESQEPTPVLIYIHGGGWMGGSKDRVGVSAYLKEKISVVSVEYRFVSQATAAGIKPPVSWPLHDAARALQFVRSKAKEWNIDKTRVAASGGSAGACSSLWLAFHDDLADPKSSDPIARESTRLTCAGVSGAQTSLDPKQMKEWMPNSKYGGHAFGFASDSEKKLSQFDAFLAGREQILPWIKEYSPYELVTSDDPPVALYYGTPPEMGKEQKDPTHSANFGIGLQQKCKAAGVECHVVYPNSPDTTYPSAAAFIIAKLKSSK